MSLCSIIPCCCVHGLELTHCTFACFLQLGGGIYTFVSISITMSSITRNSPGNVAGAAEYSCDQGYYLPLQSCPECKGWGVNVKRLYMAYALALLVTGALLSVVIYAFI